MSLSEAATGPQTEAVASPQPVGQNSSAPNQYHLHGGGIVVSYFPDGHGPATTEGLVRFTYQDAHQALVFRGAAVRTSEVNDLGTIVSITLKMTVDVGSTSFSLLVPRVNLPGQPDASVAITSEGVTTVHRAFVALIGHPQVDTYTATSLTGTASRGMLPD